MITQKHIFCLLAVMALSYVGCGEPTPDPPAARPASAQRPKPKTFAVTLNEDVAELVEQHDALKAAMAKDDKTAADNAAHDAVSILSGIQFPLQALIDPGSIRGAQPGDAKAKNPYSLPLLKEIRSTTGELRKAFHGLERFFHDQDEAVEYGEVKDALETGVAKLQELSAKIVDPDPSAAAGGDAQASPEESGEGV